MKKIVYITGTGIAVITPSKDYQVKIVDRDIPAVVEPAKVVDGKLIPARVIKPAIYEFHMETRSGFDRAMKDIPEGAEYKIVEDTELPKDRVFRNAWNYDLKEDIPKSKEIWKDKLRVDREPLFFANDLKIRDANIEGNVSELSDAIKERDRLRDITLLVDDCKSILAIKKVSV